jgi:maltooligosyltrehalose trehalohydrolase
MDGVWADDLHHQIRRALAGDRDGYFQDFSGTAGDIATTIRQGWFYRGQKSAFLGRSRGSDPAGLAPEQFVTCIQNHDQVGNRAFGDRLHHMIDLAAYRAASVLLLCCPQTPLLFMGQEWAASSPFQFFTDHDEGLGKLVTQGRRREFELFEAFTNPQTRDTIPDPQALDTFRNSRLNWEERDANPHAATLRLYQALLGLRRGEPALRFGGVKVEASGNAALLLRRPAPEHAGSGGQGADLLAVVQLKGAGTIPLAETPLAALDSGFGWQLLLSTEDPRHAPDPQPITIGGEASARLITFTRPGAALLRAARATGAKSELH